jgi:hypothetical protein
MKTKNQPTNLVVLVLFLLIQQVLATDLTITRSGGEVILAWPLVSPNDCYLQSVTNVSFPLDWSNEKDPATNDSSLAVTNQIASTSSLFRLQAWELLFDGTNTSAFRSFSSILFPSNSWFVTNGTLASRVVPNGTNLMTKSTYTNFELRWSCVQQRIDLWKQ